MALSFKFHGDFGGPGWTSDSHEPPGNPDSWDRGFDD